MKLQELIIQLTEKLKLPLPGLKGQLGMVHPHRYTPKSPPIDAKKSAVLLTLVENKDGVASIICIERAKDNSTHSGQIAFPGGKMELADIDLYHTALREAHEEINLSINDVNYLGSLSPIYIPVSNYAVYPYIAYSESIHNLIAAPDEVAAIHILPLLQTLNNKNTVTVPVKAAPNGFVDTPAYIMPNNNYIWGATAMILSELEYILSQRN